MRNFDDYSSRKGRSIRIFQNSERVNKHLVNIVAALCDEGVVVGEEVGPLQHPVQLQLGFIAGLRGDGDWKKIIRFTN